MTLKHDANTERNRTDRPPAPPSAASGSRHNVALDCGWGRLIFASTFANARDLARTLEHEEEGRRDVAFYVTEPHVVLARAPLTLFLDPSHTLRLTLDAFASPAAFDQIRPACADSNDEAEINRIYAARGMVPLHDGFLAGLSGTAVTLLVAIDAVNEHICGVVMGIDHVAAFGDPKNGSSLWALAVDPQAQAPCLGQQLTVALAAEFQARGRSFMDLSVLCDNEEAITLYRKLGFVQVPVFCMKKKNPINEKLFVGETPEDQLNIYAQIIVDEARRRGIAVEIEDAAAGIFRLVLGGRSIACRESLSDLTSAVALSRCDDKALTRRLLSAAGLRVADQLVVTSDEDVRNFFGKYGRVVVKPAQGEQGRGVQVDLRSLTEVRESIKAARKLCDKVLIEQFVAGEDLRIIVIDGAVVAGAVRKPAMIVGDGIRTIADLIGSQSRRRAAATRGESRIPLDAETERCVRARGYEMGDILPAGEGLAVRKTANLHTGGTIHDETANLHPELRQAAEKAAAVLDIPVVGFDFLVPDVGGADYVIIEANERPGLANHEPQPTAERFIDLLFPQTRGARRH
ncbi:MAG: N-acetylglutaminylglutamine synthetase [Rhodospirillales bacterium]|nr:N-acetylglutaminylglutamine synthetase [Rhodospirillales bacterium]